jgi:hypothetical protein
MEQTSVEWLINELNKVGFNLEKLDLNVFKQAKEMEKQQIIDAYLKGSDYMFPGKQEAEQYYNEKYNKNGK